MKLLRSVQRTFSISLDGVREAVIAVAERVARRVQISKLQLQVDDAEQRLQQAYEGLGHALYRARHATPHDLVATDAALPLTSRVREEQQVLQALRDRLASQDDDLLVMPLRQLEQDLKEGGGLVERVTISPGAQADGKCLAKLGLPETVRLVVVRRGDTLLIPSGSLVLKPGDELTVLGSRSAIPQALQILRV